MDKHVMTHAAAKRIARRLLDSDSTCFNTDTWRRALCEEGYTGYTAMHASGVLRKLRSADMNVVADKLARLSFEAFLGEVMELREHATNLSVALQGLEDCRL